MISHQHQCIFIHIPKTAGTSIESALGHFEELSRGVQDHRTIKQLEPEPIEEEKKGLVATVKSLLKGSADEQTTESEPESELTATQYRDYFKFTFVRNPWARAVSWYRNVMDDENHQKKHGVPPDCSYANFLKNHSNQWAMRPQTHWILNRSGENPLDFVGRFENLQADFDVVRERLKLESAELPTLMKRPGEQPSYLKFYDSETENLIAERYHEEIALFGYEFGAA